MAAQSDGSDACPRPATPPARGTASMSGAIVARERSVSPTTAMWRDKQSCRQQMATMVNMGLHVFNPEWQANKGGLGRMFSPSFRQINMKIFGTSEKLTFPVQTCTKVDDVRLALSQCLLLDRVSLEFFVKQGCNTRKQKPCEEIGSNVMVKGIKSFKPTQHSWQHPTAIIGCGFAGMKCLMTYIKDGNTNVVAIERLSRIGGFNWIQAANKSSKLQTEFGSFHMWIGQEFLRDTVGYPDANVWGIWPHKAKILEHFQYTAEQYGILPHIRFNTSAESVDIVGPKLSSLREYTLRSLALQTNVSDTYSFSCIWGFPGIMTRNRILVYPGEDLFGGHIGYGMMDECPYDHIKGQICAVLGNGAFSVENCRTCMEYGCTKVFLVTRRKSLACPRVPCWFAHQSIAPTPGWLILKMFEPFYSLAGMGDPWLYYAVRTNSDRTNAQISQSSRFGIGDITFLMCAYGIMEYVEDTLKRLTLETMHLTSGRKLHDVTIILKALGLLGDHKFDQVMKMKEAVGNFCDGDWRRPFNCDATGMHAANFSTFSGGGGYKAFAKNHKYLMDFPTVIDKAIDNGLMQQLPRHKPQLDEDKPAYAINIHHAMTSGMVLSGLCQEIVRLNAHDEVYMHQMYHRAHGTRYLMSHVTAEWDHYQALWKAEGRGVSREYVPYPITLEMLEGYFETYNSATGMSLNPYGPPQDSPPVQMHDMAATPGQEPEWSKNEAALKGVEMQVNSEHKMWWWTNHASSYDSFVRKERPNPTFPGQPLAAPGWWEPSDQKALSS